MYRNAGGKLRSLIEIIAEIGIAVCCLCGVLLWIGAEGTPNAIVSGLMIAGIGSLICWVSGLALATLGEIGEMLVSINSKLPNMNTNVDVADAQPSNQAENKEQIPNLATISKSVSSVKERIMGQWRCVSCGTLNSNEGCWCAQCGKKNEREPASPQGQAFRTEPATDNSAETAEWYCTDCGIRNRSTAKWCNHCGKKKQD